MSTPIEESNLAFIGSDEDKAAKQAAAKLDLNWEGVGQSPGTEIWRVENKRDENGNPDFGIEQWPTTRYGEFYTGDSYIVLQTSKDPDGDALFWDIYFWIGSGSSQDEYGVAAYKANELDDLLGTAPVQHRETEGYESEEFLELFPHFMVLKGGVDSGFRQVGADSGTVDLSSLPHRLFHIRKTGRAAARSHLVETSLACLNEGDAFVLDAGSTVYTWYGEECSPFEKSKAVELGHNLVEHRHGHAQLVVDVKKDDDSHQEFWDALGGKDPIAPSSAFTDSDFTSEHEAKMYILNDEDSQIKVEVVPEVSKSALQSGVVCMIDVGSKIFVWIGTDATKREQQQAMSLVQTHLKNFGRQKTTQVQRVLEGQERRSKGFLKVF